jgi:hypothetical protein
VIAHVRRIGSVLLVTDGFEHVSANALHCHAGPQIIDRIAPRLGSLRKAVALRCFSPSLKGSYRLFKRLFV